GALHTATGAISSFVVEIEAEAELRSGATQGRALGVRCRVAVPLRVFDHFKGTGFAPDITLGAGNDDPDGHHQVVADLADAADFVLPGWRVVIENPQALVPGAIGERLAALLALLEALRIHRAGQVFDDGADQAQFVRRFGCGFDLFVVRHR